MGIIGIGGRYNEENDKMFWDGVESEKIENFREFESVIYRRVVLIFFFN